MGLIQFGINGWSSLAGRSFPVPRHAHDLPVPRQVLANVMVFGIGDQGVALLERKRKKTGTHLIISERLMARLVVSAAARGAGT